MRRKWILYITLSFFITLISLWSGALNWKRQFFIVSILYFFVALLIGKQGKKFPVFLVVIILVPFVGIYGGFVVYKGLYHVYPIFITAITGFFLGRIFLGFSKPVRHILSGIYFFLILFVSYVLYPNYLALTLNKKNNYSKDVYIPDFYYFNNNLDTLYSHDIKNKILVIDVWNSACGACIKKFPDFEKVVKKYRKNRNIKFMCLNLKLKRDTLEKLISFVQKKEYEIPFYFTDDSTAKFLEQTLKINYVPHLLLFDKNRKLIYSGSLITDQKIMIDNIYNKIEKLLTY